MSRRTVLLLQLGSGVLGLVSLFVMLLALLDIGQGEPDLSLEWLVVGICFLLLLLTTGFNIFLAYLNYRHSEMNRPEEV